MHKFDSYLNILWLNWFRPYVCVCACCGIQWKVNVHTINEGNLACKFLCRGSFENVISFFIQLFNHQWLGYLPGFWAFFTCCSFLCTRMVHSAWKNAIMHKIYLFGWCNICAYCDTNTFFRFTAKISIENRIFFAQKFPEKCTTPISYGLIYIMT